MPVFFASVVGTAFLPALAAERVELPESFVCMANRALQLVMIVATPSAIGLVLISSDFLPPALRERVRERRTPHADPRVADPGHRDGHRAGNGDHRRRPSASVGDR